MKLESLVSHDRSEFLTAAMANHVPSSISYRLMTYFGSSLVLAGGFVRAVLKKNEPRDIDLWPIGDADVRHETMTEFRSLGSEVFDSEHALNFRTNMNNKIGMDSRRVTTQLITSWRFDSIAHVFSHFDLTICQAAIYWNRISEEWDGVCSEDFWKDFSDNRLRYTYPPDGISTPKRSLGRFVKYRHANYAAKEEDVRYLYSACNLELDPQTLDWWTGKRSSPPSHSEAILDKLHTESSY